MDAGWMREDLAAIYPQFGLRVAHAGLVLVPPTDLELLELVPVVAEPGGIVEPGREVEYLGWVPGDGDASVDEFLRTQWRLRERPTPRAWRATFAVVPEGRVAGLCALSLEAGADPGTLTTRSFLARGEQGRGLGTRVRRLLVELAFGHLGATRVVTSAAEGNAASLRVSSRLGHRETHRRTVDGVVEVHLAVTPSTWRRQRLADVDVSGVEPFLAAVIAP